MGKISEVYYQEIEPELLSIQQAGEFYYHSNLIDVDPIFHDDYERHEESQTHIRNQILGEAIQKGYINGYPKMDTAMLAISSIKNKVIIMAECI